MAHRITFHQQVQKPKEVTAQIPLSVLHKDIQTEINNHDEAFSDDKWLQKSYHVYLGISQIFLYTESGHRIDIWL